MAFSRATRRLAARGLVRRITEQLRDRVRYLVPTPEGLSRALALAGAKADRTAVREGLDRTRWGRTLARRVGGEP
jgi:DNA-binding MarR family transcriptional regulator